MSVLQQNDTRQTILQKTQQSSEAASEACAKRTQGYPEKQRHAFIMYLFIIYLFSGSVVSTPLGLAMRKHHRHLSTRVRYSARVANRNLAQNG